MKLSSFKPSGSASVYICSKSFKVTPYSDLTLLNFPSVTVKSLSNCSPLFWNWRPGMLRLTLWVQWEVQGGCCSWKMIYITCDSCWTPCSRGPGIVYGTVYVIPICQNVQGLRRCGVPLVARFLLHRASQRRNLAGGGQMFLQYC
jgi:hypothetical protein